MPSRLKARSVQAAGGTQDIGDSMAARQASRNGRDMAESSVHVHDIRNPHAIGEPTTQPARAFRAVGIAAPRTAASICAADEYVRVPEFTALQRLPNVF